MEPPIPPVLFFCTPFPRNADYAGSRPSHGGLGAVRKKQKPSIEGAVFALFWLADAIHFFGAALRFNEKRMLITEEATTIETAYLRLHLVPEAKPELQELFRRYLDSRLDTHRRLPNMQAARLEMANSKAIREEIWTKAVVATRRPGSHPAAGWVLLPALNNMIDMATTRTMALRVRPPRIIYALLFGFGLICSRLVGYRMATGQHRSWLYILASRSSR